MTYLRLTALPALLLCVACGKPQPPPTDQPPEPQATPGQATGLRDAIQRPIDKAKTLEPQVLDAARRQQADIEAQTGG